MTAFKRVDENVKSSVLCVTEVLILPTTQYLVSKCRSWIAWKAIFLIKIGSILVESSKCSSNFRDDPPLTSVASPVTLCTGHSSLVLFSWLSSTMSINKSAAVLTAFHNNDLMQKEIVFCWNSFTPLLRQIIFARKFSVCFGSTKKYYRKFRNSYAIKKNYIAQIIGPQKTLKFPE